MASKLNFILSVGKKDHYGVYVFERKNPKREAFLNSIQKARGIECIHLVLLFVLCNIAWAEVSVVKQLSLPSGVMV